MTEVLTGNCLIAQSGGPTSVINASLAGAILEARNHPCIEASFGALNGVLGILNEDLIDLAEEPQQTILDLRHTPGSALGTCRFKLTKDSEYQRILEVFEAHNIRYFFYIGGNDSQDTANKIARCARERDYPVRVIGIPKTIDNDLVETDHCPGYGSVIKYVATTVRELARDHESMGQGDLVSILEVMGRDAGWIAAGASLAKRRHQAGDPPHLIYLPEVPFSPEAFVTDVRRVLHYEKYCLIVVGEGLVDAEGNFVTTVSGQVDAFGHPQLGGCGDYLGGLVKQHLGLKPRSTKLGYAQRAAAHCSSQQDNDEAFLAGKAAVEAAVAGESGKMVTLLRSNADPYACETGLADLEAVANGVKCLPKHWINEDGTSLNDHFLRYALPLIRGEVSVPYRDGLPELARLRKVSLEKFLLKYSFE